MTDREADRLIVEFGVDSIKYLLSRIRDAVVRMDDQAVDRLDTQLKIVEAKLAEHKGGLRRQHVD